MNGKNKRMNSVPDGVREEDVKAMIRRVTYGVLADGWQQCSLELHDGRVILGGARTRPLAYDRAFTLLIRSIKRNKERKTA